MWPAPEDSQAWLPSAIRSLVFLPTDKSLWSQWVSQCYCESCPSRVLARLVPSQNTFNLQSCDVQSATRQHVAF